jgi:Tfp pilus assembly protein PilO
MMQVEQIPAAIQKNILNIVVLGACAAFAWNILGKQMKEVDTIKAEAQTALQKNDVLKQIAQSEGRLKILRRNINIKDKTSIINTLNGIAKDCQVKILKFDEIPPDQSVPGYIRYPFALNISLDNYHTLGKFISALESNPFLFMVDNIAVNAEGSGDSGRRGIQVSLEVSTILIKD